MTLDAIVPSDAGNNNLRKQNLSQVLWLTHHAGQVSRAELTKLTGLNRSTVGGLVAELEERRLVSEVASTHTRRVGRPSLTVVPSDRTVALVLNPEIDATEVAIVALGGRVLQRVRHRHERVPTPTEFVNLAAAIVSGMHLGLQDYNVLGVGLVVPGLVRAHDASIAIAPGLGWRDVDVTGPLSRETGLPVVLGNDADCAVVAENAFGVARDASPVFFINGGATGIGGGMVIDGTVVNGSSGMAGEIGHVFVRSDGAVCHCGASGCLETELTRAALLDSFGLTVDDEDMLASALADAWSRREGPGYQEMLRQLNYLAVGIRTVVNLVNPACIVFGGYLRSFLTVVGEDKIKRLVGKTLPDGLEDVQLRPASLGNELRLLGAAEKVFRPVLEDPTLVKVEGLEAGNRPEYK